MKKIKIILVIISIVLAAYSINTAAKSIITVTEQKKIDNQKTIFEAEITFYIYEGEGCECKPLSGAVINATNGDSEDSGVTDTNGKTILNLSINNEYLVMINAEDYNIVKYNFNIIDDQIFKFYLGKNNDYSSHNLIGLILGDISQLLQEKLTIK